MSELIRLHEHLSQLYNERKQVMYAINKEHLEPSDQNATLDFLKTINQDIIDSWTRVNSIKFKAKS